MYFLSALGVQLTTYIVNIIARLHSLILGIRLSMSLMCGDIMHFVHGIHK